MNRLQPGLGGPGGERVAPLSLAAGPSPDAVVRPIGRPPDGGSRWPHARPGRRRSAPTQQGRAAGSLPEDHPCPPPRPQPSQKITPRPTAIRGPRTNRIVHWLRSRSRTIVPSKLSTTTPAAVTEVHFPGADQVFGS